MLTRAALGTIALAAVACQAPAPVEAPAPAPAQNPKPIAEPVAAPAPVPAPELGWQHAARPARLATRGNPGVTLDNWDDGGPVSRFAYQHTAEVFPAALIARGGPIAPLERAPDPRVADWLVTGPGEDPVSLAEHVERSLADGVIVVHRGVVVFEAYPRMQPDRQHLMFSVSKIFVGTLVALLEDRGLVDIDTPIGRYVVGLEGSDWEQVLIRDILEMAAGMQGAEAGDGAYTDPLHHHYMMEASLGWLPIVPEHPESVRSGDTSAYLASLKRVEEPGVRRVYASVNTAMLSWLIESVTGKALADVLSEELVARMGAEHDALITVSRRGLPIASGGIQMTLADLARFGLLFTPSWNRVASEPVLSPALIERMQSSGRPDIYGSSPEHWRQHGAYQWDAVTRDGDLMKGGYGNQYLLVSPSKDVVIAWFGVNRSQASDIDVRLPLERMLAELF